MKRLLVIAIALLGATGAMALDLSDPDREAMYDRMLRESARRKAEIDRNYDEIIANTQHQADMAWQNMMENQRSDAIRNELMHMNNR